MRTNYARGSSFETYVKHKLEAIGFQVFRMAGSHSPVDIIAMNSRNVLLIQCKTSKTETLPDVRQLLKETAMRAIPTRKFGKLTEEGPSNVKLLEQMPCVIGSMKIILWKGAGTNNHWHFIYHTTSQKWVATKGWFNA